MVRSRFGNAFGGALRSVIGGSSSANTPANASKSSNPGNPNENAGDKQKKQGLAAKGSKSKSTESAAARDLAVAQVCSRAQNAAVIGSDDTCTAARNQSSDGTVEWTASERANYVAVNVCLSGQSTEACAQRQFLEDIVAMAPLLSPWMMTRDSQERLFFFNRELKISSWKHPLDTAFLELAGTFRQCFALSDDDRDAHVRHIHATWSAEADSEMSKWYEVPYEGQNYYYHCETQERRWDPPSDFVLPPWTLKLEALAKLIDTEYIWSLRKLGTPAQDLSLSDAVPGTHAGKPASVEQQSGPAVGRLASSVFPGLAPCDASQQDTSGLTSLRATEGPSGSPTNSSSSSDSEPSLNPHSSTSGKESVAQLPVVLATSSNEKEVATAGPTRDASPSFDVADRSEQKSWPTQYSQDELAILAQQSTIGRSPGLPIERWMQAEMYAKYLGLDIEEPTGIDQQIFEMIKPIFSFDLPLPWEVQCENEKIFFYHPCYEPPQSSWEHPLKPLHTEIIRSLRHAASDGGGNLRARRVRPQLASLISKTASHTGLASFGLWEATSKGSRRLFEWRKNGACRTDDPRVAAASHIGLALSALRTIWERGVAHDPEAAPEQCPLSQQEIWSIAAQLGFLVLQGKHMKPSLIDDAAVNDLKGQPAHFIESQDSCQASATSGDVCHSVEVEHPQSQENEHLYSREMERLREELQEIKASQQTRTENAVKFEEEQEQMYRLKSARRRQEWSAEASAAKSELQQLIYQQEQTAVEAQSHKDALCGHLEEELQKNLLEKQQRDLNDAKRVAEWNEQQQHFAEELQQILQVQQQETEVAQLDAAKRQQTEIEEQRQEQEIHFKAEQEMMKLRSQELETEQQIRLSKMVAEQSAALDIQKKEWHEEQQHFKQELFLEMEKERAHASEANEQLRKLEALAREQQEEQLEREKRQQLVREQQEEQLEQEKQLQFAREQREEQLELEKQQQSPIEQQQQRQQQPQQQQAQKQQKQLHLELGREQEKDRALKLEPEQDHVQVPEYVQEQDQERDQKQKQNPEWQERRAQLHQQYCYGPEGAQGSPQQYAAAAAPPPPPPAPPPFERSTGHEPCRSQWLYNGPETFPADVGHPLRHCFHVGTSLPSFVYPAPNTFQGSPSLHRDMQFRAQDMHMDTVGRLMHEFTPPTGWQPSPPSYPPPAHNEFAPPTSWQPSVPSYSPPIHHFPTDNLLPRLGTQSPDVSSLLGPDARWQIENNVPPRLPKTGETRSMHESDMLERRLLDGLRQQQEAAETMREAIQSQLAEVVTCGHRAVQVAECQVSEMLGELQTQVSQSHSDTNNQNTNTQSELLHKHVVEEMREALEVQGSAIREANARTELVVRRQVEEALAIVSARQAAAEEVEESTGGNAAEFEMQVREALYAQTREVRAANESMAAHLQSQVTATLTPVTLHVEQVERQIAADLARAQAGEEEACHQLAAEVRRIREAEATAFASQKVMEQAMQSQVAEAMEILKTQAREAEQARAAEAKKAHETDAAHQRRLDEEREKQKFEESTARLRLEVAEERQKRSLVEKERLEEELRRQRQEEVKRREEAVRKQLEWSIEKRELHWRSEQRELEWKSRLRQLEWQADWKAARQLEESDLLRPPDSSVERRTRSRSQSRVREALMGAIAASHDNDCQTILSARQRGRCGPAPAVEADDNMVTQKINVSPSKPDLQSETCDEHHHAAPPAAPVPPPPAQLPSGKSILDRGIHTAGHPPKLSAGLRPATAGAKARSSRSARAPGLPASRSSSVLTQDQSRTQSHSPHPARCLRRPSSLQHLSRRHGLAEAVAADLVAIPSGDLNHSTVEKVSRGSASCNTAHPRGGRQPRAKPKVSNCMSYKEIAEHSMKWFDLQCAKKRDDVLRGSGSAKPRASSASVGEVCRAYPEISHLLSLGTH